MHRIDTTEMTSDFFEYWKAAAIHLDNQVQGGIQGWLRLHPYPPFREHLSFRIGNQLFFVRVIDADGKVFGPGNMQNLLRVAREGAGHACIMPMSRRGKQKEWTAAESGWGLLEASTGNTVDPAMLVTCEGVVMTDWEVHDMSVQVVRNHLEDAKYKVTSWQSDVVIDPSIWFVGQDGKPEWVIVRGARYPSLCAERPDNWSAIAKDCSVGRWCGHFASVVLSHGDQGIAEEGDVKPLLRGHAVFIKFDGLEPCVV